MRFTVVVIKQYGYFSARSVHGHFNPTVTVNPGLGNYYYRYPEWISRNRTNRVQLILVRCQVVSHYQRVQWMQSVIKMTAILSLFMLFCSDKPFYFSMYDNVGWASEMTADNRSNQSPLGPSRNQWITQVYLGKSYHKTLVTCTCAEGQFFSHQ